MYSKIILGKPSKPDYTFITGDGKLLSVSLDLDSDEIASTCSVEILDFNYTLVNKYYKIIFDENGLEPPTVDFSQLEPLKENAITSVGSVNFAESQTEAINPNVKAGQQISVELGDFGQPYIRYEFINDGIAFNWQTRTIIFKGSVASKIMSQYPKNSAYVDIKFKDLANQIAGNYGLKAVFDGDDGPNPEYKYIPQIGVSDYQFLIGEARRIGYKVTSKADEIIFKKTDIKQDNVLTLVYGENLLSADFDYTVQATGSESVRASLGNEQNTRYQRKWKINDKGLLEPVRQEIERIQGEKATTGSAVSEVNPEKEDTEKDNADRENDLRVKGIEIDTEILFDPFSSQLNPYTGILTQGLSETLDRVWIPDKIRFKYDSNNIKVYASAYSPLKPKYKKKPPPEPPTPVVNDGAFPAGNVPLNPNGKTVNQIMIEQYNAHRGFSSRSGPGGGNVACVWAINRLFSWGGITPLWGGALAVFQCINACRASQYGRQIPVGSEAPGDFTMVLKGDGFSGHIGLVIGRGRTISNSSSRAAFVWNSDLFFSGVYRNLRTRVIYRDTRTF